MGAKRGDRVLFHYVARLEDGRVVDTSREEIAKAHGIHVTGREYGPIEIVLGRGEVIPGLEEALLGMEPGERKRVVLPPEKAYGPSRSELLVKVPAEGIEAEEGMYVLTEWGPARVVAVEGHAVVLDFNHPLAGRTLIFDVELLEVLEAEPHEGGPLEDE